MAGPGQHSCGGCDLSLSSLPSAHLGGCDSERPESSRPPPVGRDQSLRGLVCPESSADSLQWEWVVYSSTCLPLTSQVQCQGTPIRMVAFLPAVQPRGIGLTQMGHSSAVDGCRKHHRGAPLMSMVRIRPGGEGNGGETGYSGCPCPSGAFCSQS